MCLLMGFSVVVVVAVVWPKVGGCGSVGKKLHEHHGDWMEQSSLKFSSHSRRHTLNKG